ncbi:hypothetical protein AB0K15_46695 [Amycolatopsis sp. NPDC049253]|uniref:hypothetical protein n=1 Tax=Amycolatopsis sp. NPDC049253 TaxID=3155274 RepID=UPI00341B21EA
MTDNPQTNHPAPYLAVGAGRPVETNTLENSMSIESQFDTLTPERPNVDSCSTAAIDESDARLTEVAALLGRVEHGEFDTLAQVGAELRRIVGVAR